MPLRLPLQLLTCAALLLAPGCAGLRDQPTALPPPHAHAEAFEAFRQGSAFEAEALFRDAVAADPECAECWHRLGVLAAEGGRDSEAIAHFESAVRIDPEHGAAWWGLGEAHLGTNQPGEALFPLTRAVELSQERADIRIALARTYHFLNRAESARVEYQAALGLDPHNEEALTFLASMERARGNVEAARELEARLRAIEDARRRGSRD